MAVAGVLSHATTDTTTTNHNKNNTSVFAGLVVNWDEFDVTPAQRLALQLERGRVEREREREAAELQLAYLSKNSDEVVECGNR